jgi:diacylglycerol kinase (ATP)
MQRKIIYIINPRAGTGNNKKLKRLIEEKTAMQIIPFSIYSSVADGDYSFLYPVIKNENITDVVICGGDGTVNQVIGSLHPFNINFGIIPTGSGNGLAFAAGIPKNVSKALDIIFNGSPVATDAFTLNGKFACMLSGLGFDAKVAHDFARRNRRGLLNYFKLVLLNFFSVKMFPIRIRCGHAEVEIKTFFISVANANQFGNHFTIAPKASLRDGLLDVVIVRKQNRLLMIFRLLKQLAGKTRLQQHTSLNTKAAIIYFQTEQLTILNPARALLHIDGEPTETAEEINIEILKSCFRLLQP